MPAQWAQEVAFFELMTRLLAGDTALWQGASDEEIAGLEQIAGTSLPPFYEWFLRTAGKRFERNAYAAIDFSARRILATYTNGEARPQRGLLLIGYNDLVESHVFYDLTSPSRDDCLVGKMGFGDDDIYPTFETLREMLAWGEFGMARLAAMQVQCEGQFSASGGITRETLDAPLTALGFKQALACGPGCGIYDRGDAALRCSTALDISSGLLTFKLGGPTPGAVRRILGEVAQAGIDVKIQGWTPAAPAP